MTKVFGIYLAMLLVSCATSYQPNGFSGGYSDMKVGKDMYQVSFSGNGYTHSQTVQEFFLRRCADLTIEQGYDYFSLVNQESGATQDIATVNGNISSSTKHERNGIIKLFKEGTQPQVSYDAREILKRFQDE